MKKLILMVGIPGSGKTTLAKMLVEKNFHYLNADSIREELYGEEIIQGDKEKVFSILFERLDDALARELNIVVDNTNLNPKQRQPILDRAEQAGYTDVQLWHLDVDLRVCLERNKNRKRNVPEDIVSNMYSELMKNGRPRHTEGKVVLVRPGRAENEFLFFPQTRR